VRARRKEADDDGDGRRSPGADTPEVAYLPGWRPRRPCDVADLEAAVLPDGPLYVHLDLDVSDQPAFRDGCKLTDIVDSGVSEHEETRVNERELDRNAAWRLAIIRHAREVTGNVAMTCRYYGISRQVFYTWLRRYETGGPGRAAGPVQAATLRRLPAAGMPVRHRDHVTIGMEPRAGGRR
jgi:transposase-like protein